MPYFWLGKKIGTVIASTEEEAAEYGKVLGTLPYPSYPVAARLGGMDCPPFCWIPEKCLNRGTCGGQFVTGRACDD